MSLIKTCNLIIDALKANLLTREIKCSHKLYVETIYDMAFKYSFDLSVLGFLNLTIIDKLCETFDLKCNGVTNTVNGAGSKIAWIVVYTFEFKFVELSENSNKIELTPDIEVKEALWNTVNLRGFRNGKC